MTSGPSRVAAVPAPRAILVRARRAAASPSIEGFPELRSKARSGARRYVGRMPLLSIETLLEHVADANASDLHITAGSPPILRVRGQLRPLEGCDELTPEQTR